MIYIHVPFCRSFCTYNSDMTLHEETVWMLGLLQGKFGILE